MDHELLAKLESAMNFYVRMSSFETKIKEQQRCISKAKNEYTCFVPNRMRPYKGKQIGWTIVLCIMSIYLFVGLFIMPIVLLATENLPQINLDFKNVKLDELIPQVIVGLAIVIAVVVVITVFIVAITKLTFCSKMKKKCQSLPFQKQDQLSHHILLRQMV